MAGARSGAAPADSSSVRGTVAHQSHAGAAPILYHFTCEHHALAVVATGALVPRPHPYFRYLRPLVWMTDLPEPSAEEVGLTSRTLNCDRLAHRFQVIDSLGCVPWRAVTDQAPPKAIPRGLLKEFEAFGAPDHWWVAGTPVPVVPA